MITRYHDGTTTVNITSLVDQINTNIGGLPENPIEKFTIFRMPAHIRQKNKDLYEPRMVSIGPYYNGSDAFQAMEKHKWRYLQDYLSRNTENSITNCIHELRELESQARSCYFEQTEVLSKEFLMMMLLDGCFIIEFIIKLRYGPPDTNFDVAWALPIIRSDLLLLENQIPLFVIQKLFDLLITISSSDPHVTIENTTPDVRTFAPFPEILSQYVSDGEASLAFLLGNIVNQVQIKHILHIYHRGYVRRPSQPSSRTGTGWLNLIKLVFVFLTNLLKVCFMRRTQSTNGNSRVTIPSATELNEAGVIFKCNNSDNILDIRFHNGTLEIPFIPIEEIKRCHLLNLVSFEQCDRGAVNLNHLTSYACFMGCLLKSSRDVTLLQKNRIVDNLLATNEELVVFFNRLTECSFLNYETHYLRQLFVDVNSYHSSLLHIWRATAKRNYFSNPWSIISFTAAISLLALTVLQTLYTMLTYYHGTISHHTFQLLFLFFLPLFKITTYIILLPITISTAVLHP